MEASSGWASLPILGFRRRREQFFFQKKLAEFLYAPAPVERNGRGGKHRVARKAIGSRLEVVLHTVRKSFAE
jgi:hypothetical protein